MNAKFARFRCASLYGDGLAVGAPLGASATRCVRTSLTARRTAQRLARDADLHAYLIKQMPNLGFLTHITLTATGITAVVTAADQLTTLLDHLTPRRPFRPSDRARAEAPGNR
ncbi:hypothetical protein [Actinomadura rayongensis]|uniref:Uncharacterized protein n=1 Tax=Actinomadura rayongensis TaxID=1429076 RepID=A0A6I4WCN5_9ACTN|nr:hypothetical protein [Actinomadura rayongensis]MXQ65995.1 hypothetical protein [Actinomadura rayongensis]